MIAATSRTHRKNHTRYEVCEGPVLTRVRLAQVTSVYLQHGKPDMLWWTIVHSGAYKYFWAH
jgi:hypothetical protein